MPVMKSTKLILWAFLCCITVSYLQFSYTDKGTVPLYTKHGRTNDFKWPRIWFRFVNSTASLEYITASISVCSSLKAIIRLLFYMVRCPFLIFVQTLWATVVWKTALWWVLFLQESNSMIQTDRIPFFLSLTPFLFCCLVF